MAGLSRASDPGERTAEYIDYVLTRITVVGALYLVIVCLLPEAIIGPMQAASRSTSVEPRC